MTLLQTEKRRKAFRFLGGYLSVERNISLTIYCLAKNISKAKLIRNQLEMWMNKQGSVNEALSTIARKKSLQWKIEHANDETLTLNDFKSKITQELAKKEIPASAIQRILLEIK